jgi:HEAT repeat protein
MIRFAPEPVIAALLERLSDAKGYVRDNAAEALGSIGEKAEREEVIAALLKRLSDPKDRVQAAAATSLGSLASKVQSQMKPAVIELILPHARNKRAGEKSDIKREAGYVMLRNLMSAGVSEAGEANGLDNGWPA